MTEQKREGRENIVSMPSATLRALVASTNPAGKFWLERVWASDELARRAALTGGRS